MPKTPVQLKTTTRLILGDEIAFGPGKADLLLAIVEAGSISAAAKRMGMSYRRAWLLVDTMNRCFTQPLVETAKGGNQGGGAHLTELGLEVLARYRELQGQVTALMAQHQAEFARCLREQPFLHEQPSESFPAAD